MDTATAALCPQVRRQLGRKATRDPKKAFWGMVVSSILLLLVLHGEGCKPKQFFQVIPAPWVPGSPT